MATPLPIVSVRAIGRLLRRTLGQDALERAAMHVEAAGGLRDVAAAELVDALDVLPTHPIGRHRIFWRLGSAALEREQRRDNVVGVHRLGEIIDRAELHRDYGGCDVAVAGEDDGAGIGTTALERADHVETIAVLEP